MACGWQPQKEWGPRGFWNLDFGLKLGSGDFPAPLPLKEFVAGRRCLSESSRDPVLITAESSRGDRHPVAPLRSPALRGTRRDGAAAFPDEEPQSSKNT